MTTDALATQFGGDHYKSQAIQPVEFCMANHYDPCIFSIVKYVSRHDRKNGLEDLNKGEHFIYLRLATDLGDFPKARAHISPKYYCEQNKLGTIETRIILMLHAWASGELRDQGRGDTAVVNDLAELFRDLKSTYPT